MISIVILRMIQLVSLGKNEKLLSIFQIVSNEFNVMYDVELWSYSAILATPSADEITVKHHIFFPIQTHIYTHTRLIITQFLSQCICVRVLFSDLVFRSRMINDVRMQVMADTRSFRCICFVYLFSFRFSTYLFARTLFLSFFHIRNCDLTQQLIRAVRSIKRVCVLCVLRCHSCSSWVNDDVFMGLSPNWIYNKRLYAAAFHTILHSYLTDVCIPLILSLARLCSVHPCVCVVYYGVQFAFWGLTIYRYWQNCVKYKCLIVWHDIDYGRVRKCTCFSFKRNVFTHRKSSTEMQKKKW